MRVLLNGSEVSAPQARTLGELMAGLSPTMDPSHIVTKVRLGARELPGDEWEALAGLRLADGEDIAVETEAPGEFARARRAELAGHLRRIASRLDAAARGLEDGDLRSGNLTLATASRELGLVMLLDRHLAILDGGEARCERLAHVLTRVGPELEKAGRGCRWKELAALLLAEVVPAVREAEAAAAPDVAGRG